MDAEAGRNDPTRVLLVEDEPADAYAVRRSLRNVSRLRERFTLEHAATLAQGIEHLAQGAVDVMLVDLHLPDSHGPATVSRLRERNGSVPLIVFTGSDDPHLVARAFEAGADAYLVKRDMHSALLRHTIQHAIVRRRASHPPRLRSSSPAPSDSQRGLLHDLKNLHTSILGNARLLQREMPEEEFLTRRLDALLGAARAAVGVVRQLADADGTEDAPRALDLSAFVGEAEPLLRAVITDRVLLRLELPPGLAPVCISPDAMRLVVLELVVNAVEAIGPSGGCVEIRTGEAPLDEAEIPELVAPAGIAPGPTAWLEVRDDGAGFDERTRARLFESGFSTKGARRGHGLGQVEAILARHGAGLRIRSRPGAGSAFRIFAPVRV